MHDFISQSFKYEKKGDSAVILRCFARDSVAEIPEEIDKTPVSEIAPYAFSDYAAVASDSGTTPEDIPVLSGERLEEVIIPDTVCRIGRYCFYNCGRLEKMSFPGTLSDWGSGAFSGCHRIKMLCMYSEPDENIGLKHLLDELPEELTVEFYPKKKRKESYGSDKGQEKPYARLVFPEFYEEGVENTPARILETHVHGSGLLYRNSFHGRKFDFAQYDSLFPYAEALENDNLICSLVFSRLRFPFRLEEKAKKSYETYVSAHAQDFGKYLLDKKDTGGLQWFLDKFVSDRKLTDMLLSYATGLKNAQLMSILMEFRRRFSQGSQRREHLKI